MELLKKRLANLLCVKSIVTVVLTAVFAFLAVTGKVTADQFMTVFTVVVSFYFGTQFEKKFLKEEKE
jgi:5-bromo-4-chloroindolyl phosphate hydrolysis protein